MALDGRPTRRYHPLSILAAAVGVVGLTLIATRPAIPAWERDVFETFNRMDGAWGVVLFPVMQAGTLLAGPTAAVVATAARRRVLALELLGGGLAAWLLARGLKLLVGRPRPSALFDGVIVRGGESGGLGYPSGHVTVAMTLATILAAWLPGRWEWIFWVTVVVVAVGRMFVGAHLPLDLVGGALLGGLIGAAIRALSHTAAGERFLGRFER